MSKLKSKFKQVWWFSSGFMLGLTGFSMAMGAVPAPSRVTDDTAIYQRLSEIQVPKQGKINFDSDIAQLSKMEARFHENLPTLAKGSRVNGPMGRITSQKYRTRAN